MDIRKLEAFCNVYELQSFSKAGEVMLLSQPTISSHVANLEAELGVKLLDRMGRKVVPTQAGDILYRSAIVVFDKLKQAKSSIEVLRDKVVGELNIGCSTIPAHHIMPQYLSRFAAKYPLVTFSVSTGDSGEVIQRVCDGHWSIGIVGQLPAEDELAAEELLEDETVVVAAASAPWLPRAGANLSMHELAVLPWVMREQGSATRRVLVKALDQVGLTLRSLNVRCWVDGTSEAVAHVLGGVGLSVTSYLASRHYLESGALVRLNVPELEGRRHFYLIYHKDRQLFPAHKAFIEFCRSR